jgi:hypothetical protein
MLLITQLTVLQELLLYMGFSVNMRKNQNQRERIEMEKLKSRKLWMAIVSALLMVANQGLDLKIPTESVLSIAGVVMAYIFGQSYVDGKQSALQLTHQIITNAQPEPLEDPAEENHVSEEVNNQSEAIQQPILDGQAQAVEQPQVVAQPVQPQAVVQPVQTQVQSQSVPELLAKIEAIQKELDQVKQVTPSVQ